MTPYAELQVTTNYSFLEGASHAEELVLTAASMGMRAIGVADRNTLAGVVRAHVAAKTTGFRVVVGARLDLTDGPGLLCFPRDRAAYGRLSRLLSLGKRRAPKGECFIGRDDVRDHAQGQVLVLLPPWEADAGFEADLADYRHRFGRDLYLALTHRYQGSDARRLAWLAGLAARHRVPTVATNDVLYHHPARRPLQDVMTCIRDGVTIQTAGFRLNANAERHLKHPREMARLFAAYPDALARTMEIAEACRFNLDELRHEYPEEVAPGGDPQAVLERLTWEGAADRYPDGVPDDVAAQLRHELNLIGEMRYAPFFLTVHDIVRFARSQEILCQGRGSAANSAVCYCLGITSIDPVRSGLLFERFISAARNEPPDIDVDFEHERREEVIQYIYGKYGRDRAGLAATVICYRARGAIREVGKAMGLSLDMVGRLAGSVWGWGKEGIDVEHARQAGLDPDDPLLNRTIALAKELVGFPRHLSQHVGGFLITRGPLSEMVPILNASMEGRTNIEWDKDDIEALNLLKVDVLALGMLTCIRKAFDLIDRHYGRRYDLASVPAEQKPVYDMLCKADSLGVFQVESRAQMTMLPRLRPRRFYDLVIEVAIVRPGPIQGDMVHPYLRRRQGIEPVTYPSAALEAVLGKTLGVPLFQEQAMKIAIVAAGFSPEDADRLRRAMATFKKYGDVSRFREQFINGMLERNYPQDFAERCFKQIEGFGTYGFPESHAASFALLVYVSAWVKCFHPDVFACALLNSQPMGFYAPAQIVRDAAEHGVEVRAVDVNLSDWDSRLEDDVGRISGGRRVIRRQSAAPGASDYGAGAPNPTYGTLPLRLGFRQVKGLAQEEMDRLTLERALHGPFRDPRDLWRRAGLPMATLVDLARADAFRSMGLDRRQALWAVEALGEAPLPLFASLPDGGIGPEPVVDLPAMPVGEHVVEDYATLSLSLKTHPLALLRASIAEAHAPRARRHPLVRSEELWTWPDKKRLAVAGLVLVRQRPGSASGVVFITVEDETGVANLVLMPDLFEKYRRQVLGSRLLLCLGRVERVVATGKDVTPVIHVRVEELQDFTPSLRRLAEEPEAFQPRVMEGAMARADEVRRPGIDKRKDPREREMVERMARVFPDGRNFR
ncbi:error-prone DNA polymerase [Aerophototrophica crusticola]|uniref:Error-prone DNA polymerase n=1 Tax=Aerophototrophica crusticola TaxID=1709002 RepID=A0A858R8H7_9PROT|nr:error-prone DNA polymerase [Rhodospirillaceae bacterium B3]